MLKEVGASGQISLGKKYAGQLFDMVFAPDGRVELVPMRAVPTVRESANFQYPEASAAVPQTVGDTVATYRVGDGWLTPERLAARKAAYERTPEEFDAARNKWEEENKDAIEAMNERVAKIGSMGRRIHEWRKAKAQVQSSVKADRAGNGAVAEKLAMLEAETVSTERAARADLAAFDQLMQRKTGEPPQDSDKI